MSRSRLVLCALSLVVAACAEPTAEPPAEVGDPVIARVGRLTFTADPGGGIGVGEVVAAGSKSAAEYLLEVERATPLEVFLTLAPSDAAVPEALWRNHRALVGDRDPRALAAPLASAGGLEFGFDDCHYATWPGFLSGAQASYPSREWGFWNTTANIVRSFEINDQYKRRFDVCAGDQFTTQFLSVSIRRKTNTGSWGEVVAVQLDDHERYWYTSLGGTYPDWAMWLTHLTDGSLKSYAIGRAWGPEFGL